MQVSTTELCPFDVDWKKDLAASAQVLDITVTT
jgi:hypothetical protein